MRYLLSGSCRCGNIRLDMTLSAEPESYNPRACDCDFCHEHNIAFLSDPDGCVVLYTTSLSNLNISRQGDNLAEFISCASCSQILGARRHSFGCVNTRGLFNDVNFGEELSISPKQLKSEQKIARWEALWFPRFTCVIAKMVMN